MTGSFRFEDNVQTHVGLVRSENEDSVFANIEAGVWLVADGMGGHANGRLASEALAAALAAIPLPDALEPAVDAVSLAIHAANRAIFGRAREEGVQMGTTAVALVVRDGEFAVLWAGDSRAYLFRDGQLVQLTQDHTQVQDMVTRGLISPDEAVDHPMKHVLSRAVGVQDTLAIDAIRDRLFARDIFVLCSDGLHGVAGEDRMAQILRDHGPRAANALIEASLAAGAPDNVSVAVVAVSEPTLLVLGGGRA